MHRPNRIPGITLLATLALGACAGKAPADLTPPTLSLGVVSGRRQQATVGQELPQPLVVQVLDSKLRPVKGQLISFRVLSGGGSVYAGTSLTNADGIAQDYWTMGPQPGPARLLVRAVDPTTGEKRNIALFTAVALGAPRNAAERPNAAVAAGSENQGRSSSGDGDGSRER
jgi:hypothetical protein